MLRDGDADAERDRSRTPAGEPAPVLPPRSQRSPRSFRDPELCELRGYHGPFTRTGEYDSFPGWKGMGECAVCGSTRRVPDEEARRLATLGREEPPRTTPESPPR